MSSEPSSPSGRTVRVLGGVLTAIFGVPFLLFSFVALRGRFGIGDPHGYGLIFGTLLALAAGLLTALLLPLCVRSENRGVALRWSLVGFLGAAVVLVAALLTA